MDDGKKIKICFIVNSIRKCGPINVLKSMISSINKEKYDVSIITLVDSNNYEYMEKVFPKDIDIISFNFPKNKSTLLKGNEISKRINEYGFDLIHIHGAITSLLCRKVKCKKIITVHNKLYEDFKVKYGKVLGLLLNYLYINTIKKFDAVVCCSKSSYDVCKKYIKKATFVRNGMSFDDKDVEISKVRKDIREQLNIPIEAKVYIFVGTYNKNKNVIQLLEYFSKALKENEYLVTLGSGVLFESCRKYSTNNILQLGYQKDVLKYLYASDIYTSFSLTEGFSISIIEALHCRITSTTFKY